jgi:hypothetical protein
MMKKLIAILCLTTAGWASSDRPHPGPFDEAYAAKIKQYTTDERFLTSLVDYLPASSTVPSPLSHFGEIIGAPGILHYTDQIYAYLRELARHSPRVQVRSIGSTEEGREMIEVIIAAESTLAQLERHRQDLNRLADPRGLSAEEAAELVARAKPIYYLTAGLHSPETGSPEMVMELAFRLAVDESDLVKRIRDNLIVIFTPVTEPDGRDRVVDTYRYREDHKGVYPELRYWGKYVAHDNNRDGFGLTLALTRNLLASFLHWKATVMHDLHESVAFLYVSTGTGPYNEYIDPLTIQEWHNLAHEEITELTRRGMPGVWTHNFYTGWAANYLMWVANTRNSLGRFYETFGNSIPDTVERSPRAGRTSREWYRPNPPLKKTSWSLRNNTNYMQSGVLIALNYVAKERTRFLENFLHRSQRAIQRGLDETPHAYLIPRDQPRSVATSDFVNLLLDEGLEVHQLTQDTPIADESSGDDENTVADESAGNDGQEAVPMARSGDYVVRLDQPYRTLAQILLDAQNFPPESRPPYDDTGWMLPALRQVEVTSIDNSEFLDQAMQPLEQRVRSEGRVEGETGSIYLLAADTQQQAATFRFRLAELEMQAVEDAFEVDDLTFPAGTLIIDLSQQAEAAQRLEETAIDLGLTLQRTTSLPQVPAHSVDLPRVGLVHTWVATPQDAGWWRYAFDEIEVPYRHISEQELSTPLIDELDVVILPASRATPQMLVAGNSQAGPAVAWKRDPNYPHLGRIAETDDVRQGMGYQGLLNLKRFLDRGGVLITEGSAAAFPIQMGLTRRIRIQPAQQLVARGSVVRAEVEDAASPIVYGYSGDSPFPVYFNQRPVFSIDRSLSNYRMPEWLKEEIWTKEVPRTVLRFASQDLLVSGLLRGDKALAGKPAVVDIPVGQGHVILFANRPFWRWETHGSHALVLNTLLHWNDLRVGWPKRPSEEESSSPADYHQ